MSIPESQAKPPLNLEGHMASREAWQSEIAQRRHIGETALSNIQEPLTVRNIGDESRAYDAVTNLITDSSQTEEEASAMFGHIESIKEAALGVRPEIIGNPFLEENKHKIVPLIDTRPIVMADPKVQEIVNSRDLSESHHDLLEAWPGFKEIFVEGVKKGVELGYIPSIVIDRLDDALTRTSVRITDSAVLDTYGSMTAYYRNDHDEIGIRHSVKEIGEDFLDNLVHEFLHKVSGGTFKSPEHDSAEYERPRVGYGTEMKPEVFSKTGLNEAVTQHLTLGILTGDFETFDPDKRVDGDKTYYDYRKVLGTFVNRSNGLIDVKTLTLGYFEDTGPDGSTEARKKLIREVTNAYGTGALTKLDKLLGLTDLLNTYRLDEVVLSRIHPPEIDEHGNVIKKGYIDTENLPTFFDLYKTAPKVNQGNIL